MQRNNQVLLALIIAVSITLTGLAAVGIINIAQHVSVTRHYKKVLAEQEASIWHNFEMLGITKQDCDKKIEKLKQKTLTEPFKSSDTPLSDTTKKVVNDVMRDMHFEIPLKLIPFHETSHAATTSTALFIDESLFCSLSERAQKFTIGHELMHVLHQDCLTGFALTLLLKEKGYSQEQIQTILYDYCVFREYRADIEAACINSEYAVGFLECMEALSQEELIEEDMTHPEHEKRLRIAQALQQHETITV
jgi:hypothetical protein